MPTVLVIGATGNIGVAAITAALRNKYSVVAIVRNQLSADKLFKNVGTKERITTVEADITSPKGVQSVVDKVRAGELPAFQHVYSCAGAWMANPMNEISIDEFHKVMNVNFESNFYAYRATIPYLLEKEDPHSTFTQCTGAAPDFGMGGVTGASQGALFSMLKVASKENEKTNIRVNESYLAARVEFDADAEKSKTIKASDFARIYEEILTKPEIKGSRILVHGKEDLEELKVEPLISMGHTPSI